MSVASAESHPATRPAIAAPSDVRGVAWSDPRDNYNTGAIVPAHLSVTDSPERAEEVARTMAARYRAVGANVVRLGINPATVADAKWWPSYERAIRTLAREGLGVMLCAWEQSPDVHSHGRDHHNGRFGQGTVETYAAMWKSVHAQFRDEPGVIAYELLNEPFGYRGKREAYVRDMRQLIDAIGKRNGKFILVGGIGYSDDVRAIAGDFPEPDIWFAWHVYPNWFGGESGDALFTRERYAREIAETLKGVESRTVITEFGCWGSDEYRYDIASDQNTGLNAQRHVAYLHGVADACVKLKLGSIYWYADARASGTHRTYDLLRDTGEPFDLDKLAEVHRAWRIPKP